MYSGLIKINSSPVFLFFIRSVTCSGLSVFTERPLVTTIVQAGRASRYRSMSYSIFGICNIPLYSKNSKAGRTCEAQADAGGRYCRSVGVKDPVKSREEGRLSLLPEERLKGTAFGVSARDDGQTEGLRNRVASGLGSHSRSPANENCGLSEGNDRQLAEARRSGVVQAGVRLKGPVSAGLWRCASMHPTCESELSPPVPEPIAGLGTSNCAISGKAVPGLATDWQLEC